MPLRQSGSKKALKHNIEVEMEAHPGKKKQAQNLAIAFSVQRKNKRKKMAAGGATDEDLSMDQIKEKTTSQVNTVPKGKGSVKSQQSPAPQEEKSPDTGSGALFQGFKDLGGAGKSAMSSKPQSQTSALNSFKADPNAPQYAYKGGKMERKPDNHRLPEEDYMGDQWTGEDEGAPGSTEMYSFEGPSHEEYMANHFAEGGHVACMHCGGMGYADGGKVELDDETDPFEHGEGISDYQEEGPATRIKNNINTRDYNQGDDRQLSKQPTDSNEHGHELSDEDMYDMVDQIRNKLKAKRG